MSWRTSPCTSRPLTLDHRSAALLIAATMLWSAALQAQTLSPTEMGIVFSTYLGVRARADNTAF